MARPEWQNLNGWWEYGITGKHANQPIDFPGRILVPYPIESALSGVKRPLQPRERLWYRRQFTPDRFPEGKRVLLHFGAVDWECKVWVNDVFIGEHQGGYDPFSFDITAALTEGVNELIVSVWDPTDSQPIQRGKQVRKPGFIWYTAISGIWQTVWLETVPETYLQSLKLVPDIDAETLQIEAEVVNAIPGLRLEARVLDGKTAVVNAEGPANQTLAVHIPHPELWSPDDPFLYDLEVTLSCEGKGVDHVTGAFGMRKYSLERDSRGVLRFCLNHEPLFLYGPLDQGYWPDGLYTPPTDEAMRWEIDFIKSAGFNMIRKHIKIEPARYYAYCDRVGLIVWQDMLSGGISPRKIWFGTVALFKKMKDDRCYWRLGRQNKTNRAQFKLEYRRMIDALHNFTSIAIWAPFNEGWGQFDAVEIAKWTKASDPTRLVDHASGWFDQGAGDFRSEHIYFKPLPDPEFDPDRGLVLSEFGGYNLEIPGHVWRENKAFGYKKYKDTQSLADGYEKLVTQQLVPWVRAGCSAAVYTQTTDVEIEINGFLTYDRKVMKIDAARLHQLHQMLIAESRK
jgi:beta-galactosidase/beta-glucuronidase